ncbi:uncharacterized protein LOC120009359 isoform X2 [Tripterygium wilfordii]|uniref:uncharacterized protein LOC120009359 isoform X2 n=1 Tax=Tripterygium wilfordii TaxID=458696 RepID=UPI0018F82C49|nr:uncharacterized protein LOC120009359 isoform X2 [Tripterygium wilfordii]
MASATVERQHNHLHTESLTLIDLRLLSQAELLSLSLCSSSPSPPSQDDTDVSTPKIDRSAFNESAGSRKQTFSRLRLAPRNQQYHPLSTTSAGETSVSRQQLQQPLCDEENSRIVALLRRLFGGENSLAETNVNYNGSNDVSDNNLVTVPIEFKEEFTLPRTTSVGANLQTIPVGIVDSSGNNYGSTSTVGPDSGGTRKRKRGRPRKNENVVNMTNSLAIKSECLHVPIHSQSSGINESKAMVMNSSAEDKEMVMVNRNGTMVDLAALSRAEDPYGEELRRRSLGIGTEEGLLGFLSGLSGEWGSRRKKRKIVDASDLGDFLPRGWKLILCIKKKAGHVWLACRRYISPNGLQFVSCKEVSSYLLSYFHLRDTSLLSCDLDDEDIRLVDNMTSQNAALQAVEDDRKWGDAGHRSQLSITYGEHEKHTISELRSSGEYERRENFKCHKCTMAFDEPEDLLHHLSSYHHRTPKRLKQDLSITEEVIIKDGRYECQFCRKLFEERHRYYGHLGKHVKDYLNKVEASANVQNSTGPAFVGGTLDALKMQDSIRKDKDSFPSTTSAKTRDKTSSCCDSHTSVDLSFECGGLLFHDEQSLKPNRNGKSSVEDCCEKENLFGSMIKDQEKEMNECTNLVADKPNSCVGAESSLLNNEINETYVLKFNTNGINNCDVKEITAHRCSIAASGSDGACIIDNDVDGVPTSSGEEEQQEIGCRSDLFAFKSKEKEISNQNTEDAGLGGKDELISDFGSKPHGQENAAIGIEEPHSEGCSVVQSGDGQGFRSLNNLKGVVTSNVVQERFFEGSLTSSMVHENSSTIGAYLNNIFTSTSDKTNFVDVRESENVEAPTGSGKNRATSYEEAVANNDHERIYGSYSATPSRNERPSVIEHYIHGTSSCTANKPQEETYIENESCKLSGGEHQSPCVDNNENKFLSGKIMVPRLDAARNSWNIGPGNNTGPHAATMSRFEVERSSEGDLVPITVEPSKNYEACSGKLL